jgi:hypothetical protein
VIEDRLGDSSAKKISKTNSAKKRFGTTNIDAMKAKRRSSILGGGEI